MDTSGRMESVRPSLSRLAERLSKQRHLLAVRDGVIAALPLVLVGSVFLLLAQFPSQIVQEWLRPHEASLLLPYRMLGGLIALYVCFAVARALARSYGLDELGAALVAVASFLTAQRPAAIAGGGWGLAAEGLGAGGLFGAIAIAIGSVELGRWFKRRRWTLRLPPEVPEAIARSFETVVPALASVLAVWLLVHVAGLDLLDLAGAVARPLIVATDSQGGVLAVVLVDSGLWLLGVHPMAVLATLKPIWLAMLTENMAAAAQGEALPHVATRELFLWFVWQGGSGGTLAAALLLLRARSAQLKAVGKIGIVPSLFNINEPILFGLPVVMNPRLAIPFLVAPLLTGTIAYTVVAMGWVARPHLDVLWTLPAPLGAFLSTGGDWRAVLLQTGNLLLAMAIWWPFVRAEDRKLAGAVGEAESAMEGAPQLAVRAARMDG